MAADRPAPRDAWAALRAATSARIGLARSGTALTTQDVLGFSLAHARARDAVETALDVDALEAALAGREIIRVRSAAANRAIYLRRPDLGRILDGESAARLAPRPCDIALVIGDGLSSQAVQRHAVATATQMLACLTDYTVAPIVIAEQARVALSDEIGERLGARAVVMLIGERPGLSTPDSLGVYITFAPRRGRSDADRNCISNIHAAGLSYAAAADKTGWLLGEALRLGFSGVALKDQQGAPVLHGAPQLPA
jgi:ethanolamine ammonia-lyase small subunit